MFTVGKPSMKLLRLAGVFAQPEGEGGDGGDKGGEQNKGATGGDGGKPDEKGKPKGGKGKEGEGGDGGDGEKGPVPYDRFREVSKARRTAERSLTTVTQERDQLKQQLEQARSGDQAQALKAAQDEVTTLKQSITTLDAEFEDMLDDALEGSPDDVEKLVRDIPGGPRAQFAFFNKHRARLLGDAKGDQPKDKGKPAGPKNDRKPDGSEKGGPSSAAKGYVESSKPKEKGFAGLA